MVSLDISQVRKVKKGWDEAMTLMVKEEDRMKLPWMAFLLVTIILVSGSMNAKKKLREVSAQKSKSMSRSIQKDEEE